MLIAEMVQKEVESRIKSFQDSITKVNKVAAAMKKVEEGTGLDLVTYHGSLNWPSFHVERKDLPAIRRVVGRVKITGRDVPYDYETTHEIIVRIEPVKEEFSDLMFSYRTPHRGGKCHVETTVHKSQVLVCTK